MAAEALAPAAGTVGAEVTAKAPFTQASLKRALLAAEKAGRQVAGVRLSDGILLFHVPGAPPLVPAPEPTQDAPAPDRWARA